MSPGPSPIRVLIVDDDAVDRRAVRRALSQAGLDAEIEEADRAEGALGLLASRPFDCVVLDFRLPGTDGFEVLRRMRAAGHGLPVLVVTGQGDEALVAELMKAGASDYLAKSSLDGSRLARSLLGALQLHRAQAEARESARRLEESERRLRSILESVPNIVWCADADGRVELLNERWFELTGADAREVDARDHVERYVHPDDRERVRSGWARSRDIGASWTCEYRLRARDGTYRWHLARAVPVEDEQGRVVEWLASATDIEDQKRAAAALDEANRAKDVFLATISHELRTPLSAVLGWVRLLRASHVAPDKTDRALETIERNAVLQARLVDDLLDLSRITAGKLRLSIENVDLSQIVQSVVESLRPGADAKQIALSCEVEPSTPMRGDAVRLQQVVWNLVSNAVKFTPAGSVTVRLARAPSELGEIVELRVEDTGRGMSPELVEHVFDAFRQGADEGRAGGLGLGLAIVRHLVELHRGRVVASSPGPGAGSTFVVTLPLTPADASSTGGRDDPSGVRGPTSDLRVLVVDDDDDARELASRVLESAGVVVLGARSVDEALGIAERAHLDAVVSDIEMPGRDGYDLIAALRGRARDPRIPAVALTSHARPEDRERALAAGFDAHLAKPADVRRLTSAITSLVGARRDERAERAPSEH